MYDRLAAHLRESLLTDDAARAKQLSQAGWLGCQFLEALPRGTTKIDATVYRLALTIHLNLPVAAFSRITCLCGQALTPEHGARHVFSCVKAEKAWRSHVMTAAIGDVLRALPGAVWVHGAETGQAPCVGVRHKTVAAAGGGGGGGGQAAVAATAVTTESVFPDLTWGGIAGDAPTSQWHGDTVVPDPACDSYNKRAAKHALHAADVSHRRKKLAYEGTPGLIPAGHRFMPWAIELYGGTHASIPEQLRAWAQRLFGGGAPQPALVDKLVRGWRTSLSVALLHARVGHVQKMLRKIEEETMQRAAGNDRQAKRKVALRVCRSRSALEYCAGFIRGVGGDGWRG